LLWLGEGGSVGVLRRGNSASRDCLKRVAVGGAR